MRIEFHPLFATDLEEAVRYYDYREPGTGVGQRFLDEADDAISVIAGNPLLGGFVHRPRKIRHLVLKKFPYAIHYRVISPDVIYVVGIYHGARNPQIWRERF